MGLLWEVISGGGGRPFKCSLLILAAFKDRFTPCRNGVSLCQPHPLSCLLHAPVWQLQMPAMLGAACPPARGPGTLFKLRLVLCPELGFVFFQLGLAASFCAWLGMLVLCGCLLDSPLGDIHLGLSCIFLNFAELRRSMGR